LDVCARFCDLVGRIRGSGLPIMESLRQHEETMMNRSTRLVATGLATTGVLATAGFAIASGLASSASANAVASEPTVAELQAQLAQLQADTHSLPSEVTAATKALELAKAQAAARAAAEARAAAWTAPVAHSSSTHRATPTHKVVVKKPTSKPTPHTSTGASGSTGGGEHETEPPETEK
jgi:Tfp pilus assembly protein FimV